MSKLSTLFFLIRRFAWSSRESTIRAMVVICFMSITLGSFALALVMGIMNGFEHETRAVIQGIHPDLVITGDGKLLAYDKIKQVLKEEFKDAIAGSAPHAQAHALAGNNSGSMGSLAVLLGIDPLEEPTVSNLHTMMVSSMFDKTLDDTPDILSRLLENNQVIIGASLARSLAAHVGDTLTLLFAPEETQQQTSESLTLEQQKVKIAGIFKTGIDDIDARVIGLSNKFLTSFYPETGITQIGIKLALKNLDKNLEKNIINELQNRLGLTVLSWHELYPALLAALTLEKYTMFLVVALITLVASMNIVSLLYMYITQKRAEIAVARTLGITEQSLVSVFMAIGSSLAVSAAALGSFLALIAGYILKHYVPIPLPEVYYVSHVPVYLTWQILVSVIALAAVISIGASYIPARKINAISLAAILRNAR